MLNNGTKYGFIGPYVFMLIGEHPLRFLVHGTVASGSSLPVTIGLGLDLSPRVR